MRTRNRGTQAPVVQPKPRIDNSEIIAQAGCRVIHVRPMVKGAGGTLAYRRKDNGNLEVSCAFLHTADAFNKKMGTRTAVNKLLNGDSEEVSLMRFVRGGYGLLDYFEEKFWSNRRRVRASRQERFGKD